MNRKEAIDWLYASLNQRRRPEDVAQYISELAREQLSSERLAILQRAAKGSLKQKLFGYTSMLEDFNTPVGLQTQIATAIDLFQTAYIVEPNAGDRPELVEQFLRHINQEIHKTFGANDFKADRLNRCQRKAQGLDISKRRYNKLFRHLTRMEKKLDRLILELKKLALNKVGKSGLAHTLSQAEFSQDLNTAYFITYYVARCNLRSEFTIYGQTRPYDRIAEMLFQRCQNSTTTNWWAIAHVYPTPEVLNHISDEQKGELLGRWYQVLEQTAQLLKDVWQKSIIDRQTMIVRRGNDSTTWNNTANAWNTARKHWISLLYAMGAQKILQTVCIGKVLKLMAADVVAWHYSAGGTIDPDTAVWNELPLPWEVLSGERMCNLEKIEQACRKHQVDPIKQNWIAPMPKAQTVPFTPTPELVHGVSVTSPNLAKVLRASGFFSGRKIKRKIPQAHKIYYSTLQEHYQRLQNENNQL